MTRLSFGIPNVRRNAFRRRNERMRLRLETLEPRTLLAIVPLVESTSVVRAMAPTQEEFEDTGFDWTGVAEPFDDSTWQSGVRGVGYDLNVGAPYATYIGVNVEATMLDNSATAFVRAPFSVVDPSALNGLTLRLRYDDGFIAWINGVEVLRRNALGSYPAWANGAAAAHAATSTFSSFDLTPFLSQLRSGGNLLAVRGLNVSATDNDFLMQVELEGRDDRPPVANNDAGVGIGGVATPIEILANDALGTSPLDPGSVRITSPPTSGTATVNSNGTVSYTPNPGFAGADSFAYTVRDMSAAVGPGTTTRTLVSANAPAKAFVPADDELGRSWAGGDEPFNDSQWRSGTLGVGFDTRTAFDDYRPYYDLSVLDMRFVNTSVYVRAPFSIDYPAEVQQLKLQMRYDDGFVAYLNGIEVARANATTPLTYNSTATDSTFDPDAMLFQEFDITQFAPALEVGGNVLAIQGLNSALDSTDLLIQPELLATVTSRGRVSNTATVQLDVLPPNPTAHDDHVETFEQTPISVDVLSNDAAGPLGFPLDPATVQVFSAPANGTIAVDPESGVITYTPDDEFVGEDTFSYFAQDNAPGDGIFGPLTVLPFNSVWKYLPLGPDQGSASVWAAPEFDDSAWPSGAAELGYGDFDETTWIPEDPFGTPTVYFRRTFDIADPALIYELGITLYRDDGAVVYLNGVEVARSNMPAGPITFFTLAPQFTPDDGEEAYGYVIPRTTLDALLRPGTNTIAVEVHQYADISSDLSFSLGLTAEIFTLPGRPTQEATVTVSVQPNPNKPVAVADAYVVGEDETLTVVAGGSPNGILTNDTDPNLDPLSSELAAGPLHGDLLLYPDGSFTYTPDADYFGIDTFTYRASDGVALSLPVTVTLTIEPRNDAPRPAPDAYSVREGETIRTATATSDYEAAVLASAPLGYWRLGDSPGSPSATDIASGLHGTFVGGVTRGVAGAIAGDTNTSVEFNGAGRINMGFLSALNLANNFSIEAWINPDAVNGYRHFVNTWNGPQGYGFGVHDGRMALATYGILDFETSAAVVAPGRWYHLVVVFDQGNDATFYLDGVPIQTVAGNNSARSSTQSFAIGATNIINDSVNRAFDGRIDEVAFYNRTLTAAEVLAHYRTGIGAPDVATTALLVPRNSVWKYRDNIANALPYPVDAQGDDWTEPRYDDASWPSGAGLLGYGVINASPITTTIGFGGNSSDRFRTALFRRTFEIDDAAKVSQLTLTMLLDDGAAIYINGREVLRRNLPGTLGDGSLFTSTLALAAGDEDDTHTVVIDLASLPGLLVNGTNTIAVEVHQSAPDSSDLGFDLLMVATVLPTLPVIGVLANDTDPDDDVLTASLFAAPLHGTVEFYPDGGFVYTATAGFAGVDTFLYTVSDGTEESDTTTVTITVEHIPPVATPDAYTTDEDTPLVVPAATGVLANDTDTLGHVLTAIPITLPEHGTLTMSADGSFTYVPNTNFNGPDPFTYQVSDGSVASAPVTVPIIVNSVNDAPLARNDSYLIGRDRTLVANTPLLFDTTAPGSSTHLPFGGTVLFYDDRLHRVVTRSGNQILRYDVADDTVLAPITVPTSIGGCDMALDGRHLYCTNNTGVSGLGSVLKINLINGAITALGYTRGEFESNAEDIVIGASGVAFLQHDFAGSGSTPMRRLDTFTDAFMSNLGEFWHGSDFYRGPNRETIVLVNHATSQGGIDSFDGRTFARLGGISTSSFNAGVEATANRNGTLVALNCCGGISIRTRTMQPVRTLTGLSLPFAFDPTRDVFYATDTASDELVALSTVTWQQLFRIPIQENVTGGTIAAGVSMTVSSNGQMVFLRTPSGMRMINIAQPGQQLGVVGNDDDPDQDPLTAVLVDGTDHGTLDFRPDGTFSYTPTATYVGADEFTYQISDGTTMSGVATVGINVLSVTGDLNGNGIFDRGDAAVLGRNFGKTSGALPGQGDLDGDGAITLLDVKLLQAILGASLGASPPASPPATSPAAEALVMGTRGNSMIGTQDAAVADRTPSPVLRAARRSARPYHLAATIVDSVIAESSLSILGASGARRDNLERRSFPRLRV